MKNQLQPIPENTIQTEIISQIKDLINLEGLQTGEKLPSERMLSEKFGFSRNSIREAIKKLEYYGLLKSIPQSGTFIADIGITAMNGMIDDILRLEKQDFKSLVETRILLELKTASLAAIRRTNDDLKSIKKALDSYIEKVLNEKDALPEDLLFHLAIAKASGNSVMNRFMLLIIPEIIINFEAYYVSTSDRTLLSIKEHTEIFEAIKNRDAKGAKEKMKAHFKLLYEYCSRS